MSRLHARLSLLAAAVGAIVCLGACTPAHSAGFERKAAGAASALHDPAGLAAAGHWYAFRNGRPVPVAGPTAAHAAFAPWTVQSRAAGFVAQGRTLYVAVNGWGLVSLALSASQEARVAVRPFEERSLFGERTINSFVASGRGLLLHLYRNTVFSTPRPKGAPLSYVRFDPATGALEPTALPPSRRGWQAVDVLRTQAGQWAYAWKRTTEDRTQFRYTYYNPRSRSDTTISREAFFSAYDFHDPARGSRAMRTLGALLSAEEEGRTARGEVFHLELRGPPYERIERFSIGPERLLEKGEAALSIVPAVRAASGLYALLSGGRLFWVSRHAAARGVLLLPKLPAGYAYTDFWTDGRLLVASWEQQRFAEVGAAGLYRAPLAALPPVPIVTLPSAVASGR